MELLSLLVALMKAYLGVTLMLLPAASVATQLPLLFRLAQLIHHHQPQDLLQAVQMPAEHTELTVLVLMEPNIQQEHVLAMIAVQQLDLEPAALLLVVLGAAGRLLLGAFKKDTERV
jgi:hypothetical protein